MIRSVHRKKDVRGFLCPLPTVKTSLTLEEMNKGEILEILADDPVTQRDLPAWCSDAGHVLMGVEQETNHFKFFIKKS